MRQAVPGPYEAWREQLDPAAFGAAMLRFGGRLATAPVGTAGAVTRYAGRSAQAAAASALRAAGQPVAGPVPPPADRRFADPAWEDNAWYYLLRQQHLLLERLSAELLAVADLEPATRAKTEFVVGQLVDAAAPTNRLLGNPAAVKRAYETGGLSLLRGTRNFLADLAGNSGRPPPRARWSTATT